MDESDLRKRAMDNLGERRSFRGVVVGHVGVSVMMIVIWAVSGGGFFWPIFPILGMGLAAAKTWWKLFGQKPITDAEIEAEMRLAPVSTAGVIFAAERFQHQGQ